MSKHFEVLAVEGDLDGKAKRIREEAVATFHKKPHLFNGYTKVLKYHDDNRRHEEAAFAEETIIATTVDEKLSYVADAVSAFLDANASKEAGNQKAKADVIVGEEVILKDMPATLLLGLESKLLKIREVYEAIPTLPPSIEWVPDENQGKGVFRTAKPEIKQKTEKSFKVVELSPSTKEHRAQVEKISIDNPVGDYLTQHFSGMISPGRKSKMIGRVDTLISAVKTARQRANAVDAVKCNIGKKIFSFIEG